jgi:hypothetical protein
VTRHKLTTVIDGVSVSVLKYAFPVKAAKYPIKVNGVPVDAATTGGKGKSYTYFIVNNTSFYVPGVLPVDAELSIDFPGDYKFDDALTARVSSYKPKPKVEKTEGEVAAAEGIAAVTGEVSEAPAEASEIPADAPKAKRRGK